MVKSNSEYSGDVDGDKIKRFVISVYSDGMYGFIGNINVFFEEMFEEFKSFGSGSEN